MVLVCVFYKPRFYAGKKGLRISLFISICFGLYISARSQPNDISECLKTGNYYQLNKLYQVKESNLNDYEQLLCKAFLSYAYNQPDSSNNHIQRLLTFYTEKISDSLRAELYKITITNYVRLFQYKAAMENSSQLLIKYAAMTDSADRADIENSNRIWKALTNVPGQIASIKRGETVRIKKDKAGLWTVPVKTTYNEEDFIFDTGANFSVVCESAAKKNKWRTIPADFDVGTATGKKVKASLTIADSFVIGHSVFKNVVFLLIPDEDLIIKPNPLFKYVIKGIIGLPVINEFREIEIHKDGFIHIPETLSVKGYKNFTIQDFIPVLYAMVKDEVLGFQFDTGAGTSELYKTYLNKYPAEISTAKQTTKTTGGAGGTRKFDVYLLQMFSLAIADELVTIHNIPVYKETKSRIEKSIVGNLGQDVFKQYSYVIINFQDMYIELRK